MVALGWGRGRALPQDVADGAISGSALRCRDAHGGGHFDRYGQPPSACGFPHRGLVGECWLPDVVGDPIAIRPDRHPNPEPVTMRFGLRVLDVTDAEAGDRLPPPPALGATWPAGSHGRAQDTQCRDLGRSPKDLSKPRQPDTASQQARRAPPGLLAALTAALGQHAGNELATTSSHLGDRHLR